MGTSFTDSYLRWIKEYTVEERLSNGWTEIATPFTDRHNDGLVIYAKEDASGEVILSDDGYIIGDMEMSGISVGRRIKAIQQFFRGYGVDITDNNELQIKATMQTYPVKQHILLQAMMAASDMFTPTKRGSTNIFLDDVIEFFADNNIFYTQDVQFQGKSGYIHKVDFVIPRGIKYPERFVYTINVPKISTVMTTIFMWEDIQKVRTGEVKMMTVLNDEKKIPKDAMDAFSNYMAVPIPWSKRYAYIDDLKIA